MAIALVLELGGSSENPMINAHLWNDKKKDMNADVVCSAVEFIGVVIGAAQEMSGQFLCMRH